MHSTEGDRVSTLRLTGDADRDERAFDALAAQFGEEELESRGLSFFRIGMTAVLGDERAPDEVAALAEACLIQSVRAEWTLHSRAAILHSQLRGDAPPAARPTFLHGWDAERIRAVAAGKGLILCNFHFGQHRMVIPDAARIGLDVAFPVTSKEAHSQYFGPALDLLGIEFMPVEDGRIGMKLIRALRTGKVVIINTDANNGADGPLGSQGRTTVSFGGRRLTVKTGIVRLARMLGVPILPVFALPYGPGAAGRRDGYDGYIELCEPIDPAAFDGPTDEDAEHQITQALYALLEARVRRHPVYWEYARFMHRWMEPEPVPALPSPPDSARLLARGGVLRADRRVATPFQKGGRVRALVHTHDFASYPAPPSQPELLDALFGPGIDAAWLRAHARSEDEQRSLLAMLDGLAARGALAVSPPPPAPSTDHRRPPGQPLSPSAPPVAELDVASA